MLKFPIAWPLLTAVVAQATDCPHYGLDYDNQRFSGLRQINGDNAIDLISGKLRWQLETEQPLVGGVLATAGDLVFNGEGNGRFAAYDSDTGRLLCQHRTAAGVKAPPMTYSPDGVQYIAVVVGGNAL
jgi:glucose dehydrogenase